MEEHRQRQTPHGDGWAFDPTGPYTPPAEGQARRTEQRPRTDAGQDAAAARLAGHSTRPTAAQPAPPHRGGARETAAPRQSGESRADVAARARAIERQLIRSGPAPGPDGPRRTRENAAPEKRRQPTRRPAPGRQSAAHARPKRRAGEASSGRHAAPRARKRAFRFGGGMFFASAAVVILGLAWVITTLIELPAKRAEAASLAAQSAAEAASAAGTVQPGASIGPVQSADAAYTPPSAALLALPESGRVDMAYFDDALFIGDSLTRGFQEYASGIPNAHYAAYIGVGPRQFMEGLVQNRSGEQVAAIDEILAAAPKKVYLLLGTNSMATLSDEAFLKYYGDFLDYLLPQLPADTVYYLQAIPPVTAAKMEADENFSVERIRGLNERLALLAYQKGLQFLDLFSALADETGALRADIASGEIHLNDSGYSLWREFLVTHTVYRKDNPYLPGSPYYVAQSG